jgi:hypothetical protein
MKITEGIDYYFNEEGKMVLTAHYLLNRGYCCGNGCLHCPFDYLNVPEPKKKTLQEARKRQEKQ